MTDSTETESPAKGGRRLVRALTVIPATAVILANVIGTGVFVKARVMTVNVGTPGMVLLVWLCAGILTLTGALVYAELSTMMPRSGGAFHFIGAAYGRRWAYLYGWTYSVALGASVAAVAILFATGLNLGTVRWAGHVATALAAVKIAIVLGVGLGAFLLARGLVLAVSGTFDILTDIYVFVLWIFYAMTGSAVFVLRRRLPDAERPYRTWGYPIVPALFLVVALFLLVNTFIATPGRALSGFLLVIAGLPVYAFYSRLVEPDDPGGWVGSE